MTARPLAAALLFAASLLAGTASAAAAADCGADLPCMVEAGNYRIDLPIEGPARGAYVFFHGYMATAEGQMRDRQLIAAAQRHGLAFVAVDGLGKTWSHPAAPAQNRDEIAFVGSVLDDLKTRFGFGSDRIVVGGFSQGASMAWYTLCALGDRVAGAVTFSGVFWNPLPAAADCPAMPPPLVHIHGTDDRTFPLTGRAIGTRWHQGDTLKSLAIERTRAGCETAPTTPERIGGLACEVTTACPRGPMALCLHDGGHFYQPSWLDAGLTRLGW